MSSLKRKMAKRKIDRIINNLSQKERESLWQPPAVGSKKNNEVSVYSVAIPNLAVPWENTEKEVEDTRIVLMWIQTLDGFVGIYPMAPYGTLILFKSENQAKRGRNLISMKGIKVGTDITEVFIDREYIE